MAKKTKPKPWRGSLKEAVDAGAKIVATIATMSAELAGINEFLEEKAAEGQQIPLEDPAREGTQFLAEGASYLVPVVSTADLLIKSFQENSAVHHNLKSIVGKDRLAELFVEKTIFEAVTEDGKKFREKARGILGKEAPAFITLCLKRDKDGLPMNQVRVEWDRAKMRFEALGIQKGGVAS